MKYTFLDEADRSEIRRLAAKKLSYQQIARMTKRSPSTITAVLHPKSKKARGRRVPRVKDETIQYQEVVVLADGCVITVSHGIGPEHARATALALAGRRGVVEVYTAPLHDKNQRPLIA